MDVSVIIVSYNTRDHLDACLASITVAMTCSHEVIVVDNGSTDGSPELVQARHPAVRLLANPHNAGFAAANNQGARAARGRYLLLLNPDTRVEGDAPSRLAAFMDAHPEIGICAPRNCNGADHVLFGARGEVQINYFHFPQYQGLAGVLRALRLRLGLPVAAKRAPPSFVQHDGYILADWLRGCSLFVCADLYRRLGGMDEDFFLYMEDTELCRRIVRAGLRCAVLTDAIVVHYGGASYQDAPGARIKTMLAPHFLRAKYHYVAVTEGRRAEWSVRLADALAGGMEWLRGGVDTAQGKVDGRTRIAAALDIRTTRRG
jgi:GT2 family glycosyltransferase